LAAATNAAASPLYWVYQLQFLFSATTLTLLFTVYVVVLLVTPSSTQRRGERAPTRNGRDQ
jgi:hypothetical protein